MKRFSDRISPKDRLLMALGLKASQVEDMWVHGRFSFVYADANGKVFRRDEFDNTVMTLGKNYLLDNGMAGSSYTAAFYLGLISSTSYSAISAADTSASHAGWLEAGSANTPVYSETTRRTMAWSAASAGSKALSSSLVFTFTGSGTVKGAAVWTVNTKDATTGTLFSAGLASGGDQPVISGNTLSASYSLAA